MRFTALPFLPQFEVVPIPEFLQIEGEEYDQSLRIIEETPGYYNGQGWVCLGDSFEVCQVDYATRRILPPGARPLTVGCLVFSGQGELLWAKRGAWVLVESGLWEPGCAGALENISDPVEGVKAELSEELALRVDSPAFMGVAEDESEMMMLFQALVDKDEPRAVMPEVEEIQWSTDESAPGPCSLFSEGLARLAWRER